MPTLTADLVEFERVYWDRDGRLHVYPILVNLGHVRWVYDTGMRLSGDRETAMLVLKDSFDDVQATTDGLVVVGSVATIGKLLERRAQR